MDRVEKLTAGGAALVGVGWCAMTFGLAAIWRAEVVWPTSLGLLMLLLGVGAVTAARLIERVERGGE